jgi:hypothetical protein
VVTASPTSQPCATRLVLSRARVRFGSCTAADFFARCSATQPDDSAAWPELSSPKVPAALLGFRPSQCRSRSRAPTRFRADLPTCRFPSARGPVVFTGSRLSRATVVPRSFTHVAVSIRRAPPAARVRRGSWAFSSRASRTTPSGSSLLRHRRGRDCPGLFVLSQVFGCQSTRHNRLTGAGKAAPVAGPSASVGRFRPRSARGLRGESCV